MSLPPTAIAAFNVARLDIPLHAPFGISGGAQPAANNVLLTVDLADGTRGLGEAAPLPPYNGETQAQAFAALSGAQEWLLGADARGWRDLGSDFHRRAGAACGSARCALETALLDALCRHYCVPLWQFLGGAGTALETDMTITTGSPADAAASARAIRARGIRIIKVKVGAGDVSEDLARLTAVRQAAPDAPLIVDGNAGLSAGAADELVLGLKARGIAPVLLEQWLPKDDLAGMRALAEASGWRIAADEAVATAADAVRIADAGAAHVLNIKLMKAGVAVALDVIQVARERQLGLMIGGNIESMLGMSTSACVAAGLGGFEFADLDTPWFMAENPFQGGFSTDGGRISVASITRGHGVQMGEKKPPPQRAEV